MVRIEIPEMEHLEIEHLVLDYNGTIAINGIIIEGVMEKLEKLSVLLDIHVLTADTYGSVHEQCGGQHLSVHVIGKYQQDRAKLIFIESLKPQHCIAIGNGKNDALMLSSAALGIALIQEEGTNTKALLASDIVFHSINDALDSLLNPQRMIATLRN
jgi:soluble P-type ATPase